MKLAEYQKTLPDLPSHLASDDYLIPDLVLEWGMLVGVQASAVATESSEVQYAANTIERYRSLCMSTAMLLKTHGVTRLSPEATESAKHRWAMKIDPWVSLAARVDSVHQAYRQREGDLIAPRAEKLWAALEQRSVAITGYPLTKVLTP